MPKRVVDNPVQHCRDPPCSSRFLALVAIRAAAARSQVAFEQLCFQHDAVLAGNNFAREQARDDFGGVSVLYTAPYRADVKEFGAVRAVVVLVAHKDDVTASVPM